MRLIDLTQLVSAFPRTHRRVSPISVDLRPHRSLIGRFFTQEPPTQVPNGAWTQGTLSAYLEGCRDQCSSRRDEDIQPTCPSRPSDCHAVDRRSEQGPVKCARRTLRAKRPWRFVTNCYVQVTRRTGRTAEISELT